MDNFIRIRFRTLDSAAEARREWLVVPRLGETVLLDEFDGELEVYGVTHLERDGYPIAEVALGKVVA